MWKDRNLMCKLKQQKKDDHDLSYPSSSTSSSSSSPSSSAIVRRAEASRRKKMARSQDSVLKYMMKIMEVCKARGFVYGIVPEKVRPNRSDRCCRLLNLSGSSANLIKRVSGSELVHPHAPRATRHDAGVLAIGSDATLRAAAAAVSAGKRFGSAVVAGRDGVMVGRARSDGVRARSAAV
ncbi:hypothetical protein Bca52824_040208 [Brassica carinata]|uniref:Ethylene insensitive 3-like DNA-binding domain-containing protein n=1 Tax=Brassica carinata TaxID=52824 RepID=A0A8X7RQW5_BRACI|nr:hypothetical protein Bca52824_040208 [Brassica carinata]